MRARNKFLLSAVMMTILSSTMAMPSTWAAAGLNSEGRVFATTADSKFESTGSVTANGVVASNGGGIALLFVGVQAHDSVAPSVTNLWSLEGGFFFW